MDVDRAPPDPHAQDRECPVCSTEGEYVLLDGDSVCTSCGHTPSPQGPRTDQNEWDAWHEHRRENDEYEGFTGEDRIKFVGGFAATYDWGGDWE